MLSQFVIEGGAKVKGSITVSGAKNAALPILASGILTGEPLVLSNVPHLSDTTFMCEILQHLGATIYFEKNTCSMQFKDLLSFEAPYELVRKMRGSILTLGPLLSRFGKARVSLPGGCAIGSRPIDLHLKALAQMGADISLSEGYINATAKSGLQGTTIDLAFPTVNGTENIIMAATLAKGTTIINNAAREPEVVDLVNCLIKMGAHIEGHGTQKILIEGVTSLKSAEYTVISDRLEAATYAIAAIMTQGEVTLRCTQEDFLDPLRIFEDVSIKKTEDGITVSGSVSRPIKLETAPFPGFPTDLQAQFMALMLPVPGISTICENIFENRFMHVPELCRMGASITVKGKVARIQGGLPLSGANVMATDLRASFSLILAALIAQGTSTIYRTYHLDRGYENIEEKLKSCGISIERVRQAA